MKILYVTLLPNSSYVKNTDPISLSHELINLVEATLDSYETRFNKKRKFPENCYHLFKPSFPYSDIRKMLNITFS